MRWWNGWRRSRWETARIRDQVADRDAQEHLDRQRAGIRDTPPRAEARLLAALRRHPHTRLWIEPARDPNPCEPAAHVLATPRRVPVRRRYRTTRDRERLRHLVFLDGRLIETWTEPVEGTAYMAIADELDRANRPVPPVAHTREPPRPPYEVVLDWLDGVVGGRIALLALDDEPFEEVAHDRGR